MYEDTNISEMSEDTTPETDSTSAMEDDWDDIDFSDVKDDAEWTDSEEDTSETEEQTPEADQQTEEAEETEEELAAETETESTQESVEEQTFELKFLGETKTVSKDEVVTLAQKGLNYDKVLGERDTAKGEVSRLQEYESFLKELAQMDGRSVEDLMDHTRAEILAKKEGLDTSVALQRIKLDRDRKAFEAEKAQKETERKAKSEEEEKKNRDILSFVQAYPEVQPQNIPKEVWDSVHRDGVSLTAAYTAYENKKLREEVKSWKDKAETAEQNAKNKERSTGSQSTAGAGSTKKKDPIDDDWYSGD